MYDRNFVEGEFYHVFNRGVDKRDIFSDVYDLERFFESMSEFNQEDPIGSIYEHSFNKNKEREKNKTSKLVSFVSYCLNPNHFHFLLTPLSEKGIEKFMQRLGTGYTMYFNNKHKRTGSLFGGKFKSVHVSSNEYLLHLSVYINLNDQVHQLGGKTSKLSKSSWAEFFGRSIESFCDKDIILGQFNKKSDYRIFAENSLADILQRRQIKKINGEELKKLLLE